MMNRVIVIDLTWFQRIDIFFRGKFTITLDGLDSAAEVEYVGVSKA